MFCFSRKYCVNRIWRLLETYKDFFCWVNKLMRLVMFEYQIWAFWIRACGQFPLNGKLPNKLNLIKRRTCFVFSKSCINRNWQPMVTCKDFFCSMNKLMRLVMFEFQILWLLYRVKVSRIDLSTNEWLIWSYHHHQVISGPILEAFRLSYINIWKLFWWVQ